MKEPSRYPSALIISFSVSFVMYTAVGVYGYLMFGDSVKSQFTLNMPTQCHFQSCSVDYGCCTCYKVCLDTYTYCIWYRRIVASSSTELIRCLNNHKNHPNDFNFTCSFNNSIFWSCDGLDWIRT